MKTSIRNLYRLDFFQDISVDTSKGSADDKVVVGLTVKERSTSAFSFGGMYSEYEGTFIQGYFEERNFLGRGSSLLVGVSVGGRSDTYLLSYTEPWSFDIPLSAGFDIYLLSGDVEQAAKTLGRSVKLRPDRPLTRYWLGMALSATGDEAGARRELNAALAAGDFPERDDAQAELTRLIADSP